MSVKLMSQVWEVPHLNVNERLLLLSIADSSNDEGISWNSAATLQGRCGWHGASSYSKAIHVLKGLELIRKTPRGNRTDGRTSDLTTVNSEKLQSLAEPKWWKNHSTVCGCTVYKQIKDLRAQKSRHYTNSTRSHSNAPTKVYESQNLGVTSLPRTQYIRDLSQGKKNSNTGFDIQAESNSIADELEGIDDPLLPGLGCGVFE